VADECLHIFDLGATSQLLRGGRGQMACRKPATRPIPRTYGGANAVVTRRSRPGWT
jgi:hypothetical protein